TQLAAGQLGTGQLGTGQLGTGTVTLRGSLARSSLQLAVVPRLGALERYAWVSDALRTLPGSGIVYVLTVAESERVAAFLTEQGHDVAAYSGQTENRTELEDRLRANRVKALIATFAFGMGYDKPDLAFCLHLGSPASPVAYDQQVGRAGRALDDARAVLVPAESDERIWQYFATAGIPDERQVEQILDVVRDGPQSLPALEAATGIRRGRLEATLKILAVDEAVERTSGGWVGTGRPWSFDEAKWAALRRVRADEADLMRRYAAGAGCLMQFLQQALDDPDPHPCGRCSVCTGELPPPGPKPRPDTVEQARRFFRGLDVVVEARKQWPSGVPGRKGRITGLAEGRALAFADDPAWADELAALGRGDGPASEAVRQGLVEVLRRWSRSWDRPVAVVPMPSRRPGTLIRSAAAHVAEVGRLPLVEALRVTGPAPSIDTASSVRVKDLLHTTHLVPGTRFDGPVLLVDDTVRSRWTQTVAASLLVEAGATSVLPLAVHRLP
ncbi:MAG: helicase-related protein, partial [Actinomycetes bacterium]